MRARKWLCNELEVLEGIPQIDRAANAELILDGEVATSKTLGVSWKAREDVMAISVNRQDGVEVVSKRQLLRRISGIFDPCGFVAPFVVRGKALLQQV
jgi:hypothetical protein